MSNHQLIIGLGGVGGRSVAAFRRTVAAYENDYKFLTEEKGVRFEYLYIDSNNDILNSNLWSIYGRSVKLTPSDFVMLKESDDTDSIKEISLRDNIAPWIGNFAEHFARQIGKSNTGDGSLDSELAGLDGAGQLRRYGRVLFARHSHVIRLILRGKIENLARESDSDVDVRIFCSLGGGTGSGSIVDMVTLIQSLADDSGHTYRTFIYPFIAGSAQDARDTGSFYQNEYAALRDLNALMVGKYHPYLAGVLGRDVGDNYYYEKGNHPIHAIYISTEESQGNLKLPDQVDYMAKACFDTIMYSTLFKEPDCLKALSGEDLVQVTPGEPVDDPLRSYRFAALGSKRWCVPTEQIKKLLRLEYELRVLDSWEKGAPLPRGIENRAIGKVSIDFTPGGGKTWEAIEKYCRGAKIPLENAKKAIEGGEKKANVPRELNVLSAEIAGKISKDLLNSTEVRLEIRRCAQEDAANILAMLTEQMDRMFRWNEGGVSVWGLDDVRKYLEEYVCSIPSWESTLTGTMTERDIENAQKELRDAMEARENEWEKVGIINRTKKRKRISECQFEDGVRRVDLALLPFRRQSLIILVETARNGIRTLLSRVDAVSREMRECVQRVACTIHALESDLSTANSNMSDISEFDFGNLERVRDEIKKLDDEHAMEMVCVYSPAWDKVVGSFANCERGVVDGLLNSLEDAFCASSRKLHDRAIERNSSLKSVYFASIFDRLIQIAGSNPGPNLQIWDERLGKKIDNFVGTMRCSSSVRGKGLTSPQCAPCKTVIFGLPKGAKAYPGFVEWLQARLDKALPAKYRPIPGRMDFFEHNTDGEIRVLYMPYWFPARFAPVVSEIFERYKDVVRNPDEREKIYFANIDDNDIGLVSETRPALTEDGAPDKESVRKVDLACKLYLKHGDQREPLVKADDSGIIITKGINAHGIAEYSRVYSPEEKAFPSVSFTSELDTALDTALKQMNEEEKRAIFGMYTEELKELQKQRESEGMDPDVGDDIEEAKTSRMFVRKRLGLSD